MNQNSYRTMAVEGTSSVGLVMMLYDRLMADLQRAIAAMERKDIETRCAQLKHALLILQQLEAALDHQRGGEAARNLAALYAYARGQILEAQLKMHPAILQKLIGHFLDVRAAWKQVDPGNRPAAQPAQAPTAGAAFSEEDAARLSFTA
jgi:flagellar secretion chaperone FliS